jgi:hypothetical protein
MLKWDSDDRLEVEELLEHPFMKKMKEIINQATCALASK